MSHAGLVAVRRGEPDDDQDDSDDDQHEYGDDLDEREPEFRLSERPHRNQIEPEDEDHGDRHRDPAGQLGPPESRIRLDAHDVGGCDGEEAQPVGPPDEESRPVPEIVGGEVLEGAVPEIGEQQLSHRPHHDEQHHSDDDVDQEDGRSGRMDPDAGTEEETGADRAADRDELDVAVAEAALELRRSRGDLRRHPSRPQTGSAP